MIRDGRGHPGRFVLKNQPKLKLSDVLRRRRTTLKKLVTELGITAYNTLIIRCERLGVLPPTEDEFKAVVPQPVNSPQEGVVVIDILPAETVVSGSATNVWMLNNDPDQPVLETRRSRKKKEPLGD